ncbi:MAG: sugar phosphate isomerase/epimerase family protein, partial [Bacteroidales bacterium]
LEPQSELSSDFINTIDDALKWVEIFPELNLVFDTFHMDITEPNMLDALKKARDKIGLIHIADTDRKVPGEGSIDFMNIFHTLKEIGFEGPCSFEIRQNPDQATVCLKAIQAITKYFTN